MNQQINLYLPEFRKNIDSLSAANALKWLGGVVILLAAITAFKYWSLFELQTDLSLKQQEYAAAAVRTNALIASFGEQAQSRSLLAEVVILEEGLAEKEALLRFLEGRELGNIRGFSEFLADLSRYHVQGLRITGVDLRNGGDSVLLSGEVLRAEYVPIFLQRLSQGRSYAGKNFETLRIEEKPLNEEGDTMVMAFGVATGVTSRN